MILRMMLSHLLCLLYGELILGKKMEMEIH
jgi:hypothetical protein